MVRVHTLAHAICQLDCCVERNMEIERENRLLLEKMSMIVRSALEILRLWSLSRSLRRWRAVGRRWLRLTLQSSRLVLASTGTSTQWWGRAPLVHGSAYYRLRLQVDHYKKLEHRSLNKEAR